MHINIFVCIGMHAMKCLCASEVGVVKTFVLKFDKDGMILGWLIFLKMAMMMMRVVPHGLVVIPDDCSLVNL